jgi:OFA family oxalate/formate antiporter-like MFS transporter
MFASQALLYCYIPQITSATVFTIAACYLLACYGGGFAVMPSFAADSFGPGYIGKVYGIILTAWGAAGVAGPLVFAQVKGAPALYVAAALLVLGFIITWSYKPPVKATA